MIQAVCRDEFRPGYVWLSALSNEANLGVRDAGWLVFGVHNKTRKVVGTEYRRAVARLNQLKQDIANGLDPSVTFREIHELMTPEGRVVMFEIPPAPRGIPMAWNSHYYARNGESLAGLDLAKLDEIRGQGAELNLSRIEVRLKNVSSEVPIRSFVMPSVSREGRVLGPTVEGVLIRTYEDWVRRIRQSLYPRLPSKYREDTPTMVSRFAPYLFHYVRRPDR